MVKTPILKQWTIMALQNLRIILFCPIFQEKFIIKDVTSITKPQLSGLLWTYLSFYQLFLYLFIMVNLCAMDYNSWLDSYDNII